MAGSGYFWTRFGVIFSSVLWLTWRGTEVYRTSRVKTKLLPCDIAKAASFACGERLSREAGRRDDLLYSNTEGEHLRCKSNPFGSGITKSTGVQGRKVAAIESRQARRRAARVRSARVLGVMGVSAWVADERTIWKRVELSRPSGEGMRTPQEAQTWIESCIFCLLSRIR